MQPEQQRNSMGERMKIVIVGGVAGGASAAARARRLSEEAQIVVFERGESISFANCGMPYHIGGMITDRNRLLVQTPESMRNRFEIDVRTRTEVLRIDREQKQVVVRNLVTGDEYAEPYDKLVLSPGAEPVRPALPGVQSEGVLTLRSLTDMDAIKSVVDEGKPARAVVVGGGYIGLEMTEALRERGVEVTLVELMHQVFAPADPEMAFPVQQELKLHGVDLRLGTSVTAIQPADGGLTVSLSDGDAVACGLVILSIGVRPEVALARQAGLELGTRGGIAVDEHMRTSDPDIYAAGDAVEVKDFVGDFAALVPLAGPANRQGRIAADNLFGRPSAYHATQGTAICKVFGLAIGMTGLSEKTLRRIGRAHDKVYVHPASHASYYPGAAPMSLKLLFDPQDGKVLGAQAVGADGVDKRIDVIATAVRAGMTVYDLEELELSYAPPYGSAKDPVNYAGFVAANALRGDVRHCHFEEVSDPDGGQLLLDVRTPVEVEAGTIPGAVNVPVDDLRRRMGELPKDRELLVFCQVGLRGYLACRMLEQHGFRCRNLTGGYKIYLAATGAAGSGAKPPKPTPAPREMRDDTGAGSLPAEDGEGDIATATATTTATEPKASGGSGPAHALVDPAVAVARMRAVVGAAPVQVVQTVDATGLQCPGPIMQLKRTLDSVHDGQAVSITASDPAFAADVAAWCQSTGNELLELSPANGHYCAKVRRRRQASAGLEADDATAVRKKTIIVFSNDFDRAMAAFIIANGAAAMGSEVTMFFTFWGLNVLRRPQKVATGKTVIERMFGWMMPRGADRLRLSKMNMGGMGLRMIKGIMRKKNVAPLPELMGAARAAGVKLVACSMSLGLMGIKREELVDGVEEGGVAMYLSHAERGHVNLFI